MAVPVPSPLAALNAPLGAADFVGLGRLRARLPLAWTRSRRRRRLLFLGLASPGFLLVFLAPLHRDLALLLAGFPLFAAALVFRARTEPLFARGEAAALWPPSPLPHTAGVSRHG